MIIVAIDNNYNNGLVDFIINVKLPIPVLALGWEHGLSSLPINPLRSNALVERAHSTSECLLAIHYHTSMYF